MTWHRKTGRKAVDQLKAQAQIDALAQTVGESLTRLLEAGPDPETYRVLDTTVDEVVCLAMKLMGEKPCQQDGGGY